MKAPSMKFLRLVFLILYVLSLASAKDLTVTVKNPATVNRPQATVALPWMEVYSRMQRPAAGSVSVVDKATGKELITQSVDNDGDGVTDEFLFQSDFAPMESKSFLLKKSAASKKVSPSLVDGMFAEPRQDYAWENDRIAFRMYGPAVPDVDNGIDVWTKRVHTLVVKKWYKGEEAEGSAKISYHEDHGEGADFFAVGKTLGCGSCGLWVDDTLRQPGNFLFYRTIANGPLRIVFEVTYPQWNVRGKRYLETKTISLDAGSQLNEIDVVYHSLQAGEPLQIAAGIVKRKGTTTFQNEESGWISLWGPTNDDPVNESLGIAVVVPKNNLAFLRDAKDQLFAVAGAGTGTRLTYYAGAAWTRLGDFASAAEWNAYLQLYSRWLAAPLTIAYPGE
jgi:hypothetical protein